MTSKAERGGWIAEVDHLLRVDQRPSGGSGPLRGWSAILFILLCGGIYGAVMATFAFSPERALLMAFGALKVPILFGVTMILAIPAFYVMNAQRGVGEDFKTVLRLLMEYQLRVVVVLVALVPITALLNFTTTTAAYGWVQFWNSFVFLLAALLAQRKLALAYAPLIARDSRHRILLRVWTALYAFIGIQMGWTLRPFIGQPDSAIAFIRTGEFDNAYVELWQIFGRLFGF